MSAPKSYRKCQILKSKGTSPLDISFLRPWPWSSSSHPWALEGFFPGAKSGEISFYPMETASTTSFAENFRGKYQISKSMAGRDTLPLIQVQRRCSVQWISSKSSRVNWWKTKARYRESTRAVVSNTRYNNNTGLTEAQETKLSKTLSVVIWLRRKMLTLPWMSFASVAWHQLTMINQGEEPQRTHSFVFLASFMAARRFRRHCRHMWRVPHDRPLCLW